MVIVFGIISLFIILFMQYSWISQIEDNTKDLEKRIKILELNNGIFHKSEKNNL